MTLSIPAYPNWFGRHFLLTVEELTGKTFTDAVLRLAGLSQYIDNYPLEDDTPNFPLTHFSAINLAFYNMCGRRNGRDLTFRIGSSMINAYKADYLPIVDQADFSDLLIEEKIKAVLLVVRSVLERFRTKPASQILFNLEYSTYSYLLPDCPTCYGMAPHPLSPSAGRSICHFIQGFLFEALYYGTGKQSFLIEQPQCSTQQYKNCVFVISKTIPQLNTNKVIY
jgi:hypothetical protein